jgi:acyl-CoA reductase-like NAD-dependent aldehyde dehydrogenase
MRETTQPKAQRTPIDPRRKSHVQASARLGLEKRCSSANATTISSAANGLPSVEGKYSDNPSPITGKKLCVLPRSTAADIELALDAAHKAKETWAKTSVRERSRILNKIADKFEANLDLLALIETFDNGKPIREIRRSRAPGRSSRATRSMLRP